MLDLVSSSLSQNWAAPKPLRRERRFQNHASDKSIYHLYQHFFLNKKKEKQLFRTFFCNCNLRYVSLMRFGGFCWIHEGIYVLSVRLRRSSEPPSNFPNSKQPWRFWGSAVMNRRLSGSSLLRSTISVLREPPRVRLWIRRVFHSIKKYKTYHKVKISPDLYFTQYVCQKEKASGRKHDRNI